MPTVAEIKAQHALLKQGNMAINPPERPKPEDIKASPTATLRAEAEAARAQSLAEKDSLAGDPVLAEPESARDNAEMPASVEPVQTVRRKPGRPRKPSVVVTETTSSTGRELAVQNFKAEPTAQALAANPTGAPEPVKVGQAAPETRSSWTLGDLQRLSEELASHGIVIIFSFKEASNG